MRPRPRRSEFTDAHRARRDVQTNKLRLKANEAKSEVARPEERKFVGFSIANDGSKRRIAPKALDKFKARIREMTRRTRGNSLPQMIADLAPYLLGWRGYFGFCQTPRVLTNLEAWIRRRLRAYLWRQWQHGPNRFNIRRLPRPSRDAPRAYLDGELCGREARQPSSRQRYYLALAHQLSFHKRLRASIGKPGRLILEARYNHARPCTAGNWLRDLLLKDRTTLLEQESAPMWT
jgi:hypothetical protein